MRRIAFTTMLFLCLITVSGCSFIEWALSDIGGLDLSACASKMSVCIDLYLDNADQFSSVGLGDITGL